MSASGRLRVSAPPIRMSAYPCNGNHFPDSGPPLIALHQAGGDPNRKLQIRFLSKSIATINNPDSLKLHSNASLIGRGRGPCLVLWKCLKYPAGLCQGVMPMNGNNRESTTIEPKLSVSKKKWLASLSMLVFLLAIVLTISNNIRSNCSKKSIFCSGF